MFERQFRLWCEAHKLAHLDQLTPTDLTEFRASWGNGEVTTHRKHERMVSFFAFCVRNELLHKNAMEALKKPKTPDIVPTDYFRPDEFQALPVAGHSQEAARTASRSPQNPTGGQRHGF